MQEVGRHWNIPTPQYRARMDPMLLILLQNSDARTSLETHEFYSRKIETAAQVDQM